MEPDGARWRLEGPLFTQHDGIDVVVEQAAARHIRVASSFKRADSHAVPQTLVDAHRHDFRFKTQKCATRPEFVRIFPVGEGPKSAGLREIRDIQR